MRPRPSDTRPATSPHPCRQRRPVPPLLPRARGTGTKRARAQAVLSASDPRRPARVSAKYARTTRPLEAAAGAKQPNQDVAIRVLKPATSLNLNTANFLELDPEHVDVHTPRVTPPCPAERCALSSRVMTPRAVCQEYKVVAPLTKTKAARHGPRIGDAARRGTEARSPTSSATSMPLATPRSATGSRSWAARAKAPWASTALSTHTTKVGQGTGGRLRRRSRIKIRP